MKTFYRNLFIINFFSLLPVVASGQTSTNYSAQTIFQMPKGHFFENIALGPDKAFYITDYTGKTIHRYTPESGLTLFKTTDDHPVSLRLNSNGEGVLAVHRIPIFAGPSFTTSMAVYRINTQGELSLLQELPEAAFLNGMTTVDEQTVLLGDAINGIIWKVDLQEGQVTKWLESSILTQNNVGGHIPGVNGIQVYGNDFYAANGDRALLLHTKIDAQGNPGQLTVLHENVVVDDFVVDDDKSIYATTHGETILKIGSDGTVTPIADKEQGVTGSTAAQFGAGLGDPKSLYVITDGGLISGNDNGANFIKITTS